MRSERAGQIVTTFFLVILSIVVLFPLYIILVMSSYTADELYLMVPYTFGTQFFQNTKDILTSFDFQKSFLNSIIVSALSVVFGVLTTMMYGYGVAKYCFKMKKVFSWLAIVLMMIPSQVTIVGYVMQMRSWQMVSTIWPLVFNWLANPLAAFFMIQFAKEAIPNEVIESGRIDGANELRIFFSLAVHFMMPAIASIGILLFLWSWNNYLLPLIMLDSEQTRTLPLFIKNLTTEYRDNAAAKACGVAWTTIPLVAVYCCFSKTFISGIAAGSVKG